MNFEKHLEEQLKDEEFKKEWEDLQPEYSIIDSLIKARLEQGITQKQLSEMTGIQQSNISRLESGNYNPTINFLKRIANRPPILNRQFDKPKLISYHQKQHQLHC